MVTINEETREKPKIISEIKKNCFTKQKSNFFTPCLKDFAKAKISGWIYWKCFPRQWVLGWAEVKGGSLFIGTGFRIPLMRLHLQPCKAPRTFKLFRGPETRPFIFRAPTEEEYVMWVKALAVELIKQTPLVDVPFLDIISITRNLVRMEKNSTETKKKKSRTTIGVFFSKAITFGEKTGASSDRSTTCLENEIDPGKKAESFSFVSVREKKNFFESLIDSPSTEIESYNHGTVSKNDQAKGAQGNLVAVREMRRFFETETESGVSASWMIVEKDSCALLDERRLQRGERKLSKLRIQMVEVEETARSVARDLEIVVVDFKNGSEKEEISAALLRKLQQEHSRLERLQEETERVIQENRKILQKLQSRGKK